MRKRHTPGEWRTGRKVGRTIYANDVLIGVMDRAEDAARVVMACNAHDELLEACKASAEAFCSLNCPSQWKTADYPSQPHIDVCVTIRAAIAKAEPKEQ